MAAPGGALGGAGGGAGLLPPAGPIVNARRPNLAANAFANIGRPVRQGADIAVHDIINPKTPAQLAALAANPLYRPNPNEFFDNTPHPINRDQHGNRITMLAQGQRVIDFLDRVVTTAPSSYIMNHTNISSNLKMYIKCVQKGLTVTTLIHAAFGFNQRIPPRCQSINSWRQWLAHSPRATAADVDYYYTWLQPLLDYVFNWVIPPNHLHANLRACIKYSVKSFRDSVFRVGEDGEIMGRMTFPVWSSAFVEAQEVGPTHTAICNGHFREYYLMIDLVIAGFAARLQRTDYYVLAAENVPNALQAQANQRFYGARH